MEEGEEEEYDGDWYEEELMWETMFNAVRVTPTTPSASTWAATLPDQGGRSKLFVRRGGVHTFRITGHQHCPRKAKKDPKQLKKAPKSLKKAPKRNRVSCHDVGW